MMPGKRLSNAKGLWCRSQSQTYAAAAYAMLEAIKGSANFLKNMTELQ